MLSKKELEDLRPWLVQSVQDVLGFPESVVVNAALDCLGRSLSRQATTEHLTPYLEQNASSFVDNLYMKVLQIKSTKLINPSLTTPTSGDSPAPPSKKRTIKDIFSTDNDPSSQDDDPSSEEPPKKKKLSRFLGEEEEEGGMRGREGKGLLETPPAADLKEPQDIQKLLATTMKQIEERKKQTQALLAQKGLPMSSPPPAQPPLLATPPIGLPLAVPPFMRGQHGRQGTSVHPLAYSQQLHEARGLGMGPSALDKAIKAAELQARIKSQLATKPDLLKSDATMSTGPTPLILDEEGRTVDSSGKTIQIAPRAPSFMVNMRTKQKPFTKPVVSAEKKAPVIPSEERPQVGGVYYDPRMSQATSMRTRKQFTFNEPGKYIKQAQVVRAKTQLEYLQSEIASVARKTGISSATKLALIAPTRDLGDEVPAVEWWDAAILPTKCYSDCDKLHLPPNERYKEISALIEHPIVVQPPGEPVKPPSLPIMLTSKERKKLRRQKRREAEKEKQEKIQFGLIDKPEPKVRISNLMRVLGNDAVQDPTKVEAHVRAQMAERQRKHEKANAQRKLTPEERKAKKVRKLKEDLSCGVHVTVYRVRDVSNPANKFKVDMNAQQYHLTGCMLLYQDVNIVAVEGGPKCLKKFKRLMTHRIKWKPKKKRGADPDDDDDDSDDEYAGSARQKACTIVWEGKVLDRAFSDWRVRYFPTENLARDHLKRHGVEHYWDLALSQIIVDEEGD